MTQDEANAIAKAKLAAYTPLTAERLNELETDLYKALADGADNPIGVRIEPENKRWRTKFYAEWRDSGVVSAYVNAMIGSGASVKWPELRDLVAQALRESRQAKAADAALLAARKVKAPKP